MYTYRSAYGGGELHPTTIDGTLNKQYSGIDGEVKVKRSKKHRKKSRYQKTQQSNEAVESYLMCKEKGKEANIKGLCASGC